MRELCAVALLVFQVIALSDAARADPDPPLPPGASAAILPMVFEGDAANAFLADGVSDSLIDDLSTLSGLFLIARDSSALYRERPDEPRRVARELGIRWLVRGTVTLASDEIDVSIRMLERESGRVAWQGVFRRPRTELQALLDELRGALLSAMEVTTSESESAALVAPHTASGEAFESYLLGLFHYHRRTPEDFAVGRAALQRAVDLDPGFARAHAILAALYIQAWRGAWHEALGFAYGERARPLELAERHLEAAMVRPTALALRWKARLLTFKDRAFDQAVMFAELATQVQPSSPEGYIGLNYVLGYMHEFDRAERVIRRAIRLSPLQQKYRARLGWVHYFRGDYEAVVWLMRRAIAAEPDEYVYYVNLVSALGHLGRLDEAALAIADMQALRARLGMTPVLLYYLNYWPFKFESDRALMRSGLEKAGLQD